MLKLLVFYMRTSEKITFDNNDKTQPCSGFQPTYNCFQATHFQLFGVKYFRWGHFFWGCVLTCSGSTLLKEVSIRSTELKGSLSDDCLYVRPAVALVCLSLFFFMVKFPMLSAHAIPLSLIEVGPFTVALIQFLPTTWSRPGEAPPRTAALRYWDWVPTQKDGWWIRRELNALG